jgi:hypothetical protein
VEFYFSADNLRKDKFMLAQLEQSDRADMVPIALIASFNRMKKLVKSLDPDESRCLLLAALRASTTLAVSEDGHACLPRATRV